MNPRRWRPLNRRAGRGWPPGAPAVTIGFLAVAALGLAWLAGGDRARSPAAAPPPASTWEALAAQPPPDRTPPASGAPAFGPASQVYRDARGKLIAPPPGAAPLPLPILPAPASEQTGVILVSPVAGIYANVDAGFMSFSRAGVDPPGGRP